MLTYSEDDLARAAELGRTMFPDLDSRSTADRCFIACYALSSIFEAHAGQPHGDPWFSPDDQRHGLCLRFPRQLDVKLQAAFTALSSFGFVIRGSLLSGSEYRWWSTHVADGFTEGAIADLELWLRDLEAPSVSSSLRDVLADMHPTDLSPTNSRPVYTRLGLALLGEHAKHDKHHDVYRDLALLALTEVTFPDALPLSCFHTALDPVLQEDVYS